MTIEIPSLTRLTADEYHADPCPVPSLSASIANELIGRSALHAYTRHPRLGGVPRAPKKHFDAGTLAHKILLGAGAEIEIIEAADYKTNVAKAARDAARKVGKIPALVDDYAEALESAKMLRMRFESYGIKLTGHSEVAAFWHETATNGNPVLCRGMFDHLSLDDGTIYDLKSCRSAHPAACQRHADSYGYAVQRAAYTSALEKARPELAGRTDFVFVFFELEAPWVVTPVRMDGTFRALGEARWRRAVDAWERCLRENRWPAYVDTITDMAAPPWAVSKDLDQQMAAGNENFLTDVPWEAAE